MKKKKFNKRRPLKKVFSIIVDGQTEKWYFQLANKYERFPRIDVKPELAKKKKLREMFQLVVENATIYDKVFWLIDLDIILQNNQTNEFKNYFLKLKRNEKVVVLVNNPCLELWFLLHFKETARVFTNCESAEKELMKNEMFKDYRKTEKYYKSYQNDVYQKLKPFQQAAVARAEKLGEIDFSKIEEPKAEIYKIFDMLG